jgi:hypothetical protein
MAHWVHISFVINLAVLIVGHLDIVGHFDIIVFIVVVVVIGFVVITVVIIVVATIKNFFSVLPEAVFIPMSAIAIFPCNTAEVAEFVAARAPSHR